MKRQLQLGFGAAAICVLISAAVPQRGPLQPGTHVHAKRPPTFNRDIAPILFHNCSRCHEPRGIAPFPLLSYREAKRHAIEIAAVTRARWMPPWLPEAGYGNFVDPLRLTDGEIETIQQWVATGAREGNASDLRVTPQLSEGWQLGKPDLVITLPQPYTLPARAPDGADVFRNFVLPLPIGSTRYLRAVELHPGANKVFHHANILLDNSSWARKRDARDGQPGFSGMELYIESNRFDPDSQFLFWKPGSLPRANNPEMALTLSPGTDLVLNMHMRPDGNPEEIQPAVGLYLTWRKPTRFPLLLQLENDRAIDIAPGDAAFSVADDFVLPVDVQVMAVYPHAHYVAKEVRAFATLPDGSRKWLIWIKRWNFDWQGVFTYAQPVYLPAGSTLHMRWTYDNSTSNPRNPYDPPRRVRAGNNATDEMAHLWLQVLAVNWHNPRVDPRLVLQTAMMRHRIKVDPDDYAAHFNLAADLQLLGNTAAAIAEYREACRLRPNDPGAINGLGSALELSGYREGAFREYQRAVAADPGNADANYNLARQLLAREQFAAAVPHLQTVLHANAKDAAAWNALGRALAGQGDVAGSSRAFRQALQYDPDYADAHFNLALVLAGTGELASAEDHLRNAVRLRSTNSDFHFQLADVLAREDKLPQAEHELTTAIQLDPNNANAHADLGTIFARTGELQRAKAEFERALAADPNNTAARQNLASIQSALGSHN